MKKIMKKNLPALFVALIAISGTPLISLADTYQYVNTSGTVEAVNAQSPADAFALATDRDPTSGVMHVTPVLLSSIPSITTVITNPATVSTDATTSSSGLVMWSVPGTYTGVEPATETNGETAASSTDSYTLTLTPQGTATLMTMYGNSAPSLTQSGTWSTTGTNQIQVSLNSNGSQTFSPARITTFSQNGTGLVATQYSSGAYGMNGLTLNRQN